MSKLSLTVSDDLFHASFCADTVEDLFAEVTKRSEELARYAASRNALATATVSALKVVTKTEPEVERPLDPKPATPDVSASTTSPGGATVPSGQNAPAEGSEPRVPIDYDTVKDRVQKVATTKGRQTILAVLSTFGVDHATKLTAAQWPSVVEALDRELAA